MGAIINVIRDNLTKRTNNEQYNLVINFYPNGVINLQFFDGILKNWELSTVGDFFNKKQSILLYIC